MTNNKYLKHSTKKHINLQNKNKVYALCKNKKNIKKVCCVIEYLGFNDLKEYFIYDYVWWLVI